MKASHDDEKLWRPLFDGRSKDGWEMTGSGEFKLESGELVTCGGMGLLWYTKEQFSNCDLKVIFKLTGPHDNSGVFIRIPEPPPDPWLAVHRGYEVQIFNPSDSYHRTGCLYSLTSAQNIVDAKLGEWNTMVISLEGLRTRVELNEVLVTDYTEGDPVPEKKIWYEPDRGPRPESGYIGLQNHDDNTRVHFREVSVCESRLSSRSNTLTP